MSLGAFWGNAKYAPALHSLVNPFAIFSQSEPDPGIHQILQVKDSEAVLQKFPKLYQQSEYVEAFNITSPLPRQVCEMPLRA